jgi:signal transduction histidine kinase
MTGDGRSASLLHDAFGKFERVAKRLEKRHDELRHKVEGLERQLVDAHRRLEAVLDALEEGVAVIGPGGVPMRTNPAFEKLGLGTAGAPLTDPDVVALLGGGASGTVRVRRPSASGERDLTITAIAVGDEEGTHVLTVQDTTDLRREEEEGGRRRRLEALGRMAAEIAHEVRNPLGSIRLFACLLRDELDESGRDPEMADRILAATAGLETAVSNLLSFATPPRGDARRFDLADLAADVCALLGPVSAQRGVSIRGPREGETCDVVGDPEALRQVLLNLLGNSLAATGKGGFIEVGARLDRERAVLEVEDSGCGIAPEDLPRVFDPFFSKTAGGTGLGLSIVHGIVERHGGRIRLESRPGRGTRASVEIPRRGGSVARTEVRGA